MEQKAYLHIDRIKDFNIDFGSLFFVESNSFGGGPGITGGTGGIPPAGTGFSFGAAPSMSSVPTLSNVPTSTPSGTNLLVDDEIIVN